jgi:hypothetical protein
MDSYPAFVSKGAQRVHKLEILKILEVNIIARRRCRNVCPPPGVKEIIHRGVYQRPEIFGGEYTIGIISP